MATVFFPFPSFPSAATYHHHFPSEFTTTYAPGPDFPDQPPPAANQIHGVYYPLPASAYTTASDFYPPPPPAATPSAPNQEQPQPHPALHTSASKIQPGLAQLLKRSDGNASLNDDDHSKVDAFHTAAFRRQPDGAPVAVTDLALLLELHDRETNASSPIAAAITTTPSALIFPKCSNTVTNCVQQAAKAAMGSQSYVRPVPVEEAVCGHLVREISHIQDRLQHQQYSLQSIQGEVANLQNRVAEISISLGMQHLHDGTIHSQASCFAIQQDVQFSEMSIGDVNDAETDGYLFKNEIPSQPSPVSGTATDQTQFQTIEKMPVYDVYEEDTNASPHGVGELSETVGQHRQYDSKKLGATKLSSWESDNEVLAVCFDNASDNAFSEEATGFSFPHGPVTHTDRSIKLTNEKTTQAAYFPCVQEDNMHCHDPRSGINSKKQDALINKHSIIYPSDLNTDKEVPFPLQYQLPLSSAPCIWDPGINLFSYRKLHIFPWIPSSAIIILQQVHNKNISSLLEFSLEKGRHVHWDPGIKLLLCELLWLKTMTKGTEYALRHLLALNFGTHDSTYSMDTTATICSPAIIIQQGRNFASVLYFWLSIFNDMQCCQIFQKCNGMSSRLCWHQDIKFNGIALWMINFQVP